MNPHIPKKHMQIFAIRLQPDWDLKVSLKEFVCQQNITSGFMLTAIGGHLDYGCIIYTTAEIVIGTSEELTFLRTVDEQTGFMELEIRHNL